MADRQPRVVLDTNVLVSALLAQNRGWDTPPLRCVGLALRGEMQLSTSPGMVAELLRALRYPKLRVPVERAHAFAGVVVALADPDGLVRTTGRLAVLRRDAADNLVIETARFARHVTRAHGRRQAERAGRSRAPASGGLRREGVSIL